MRRRIAGIIASLVLAMVIFTVSILEGVTPRYASSPAPTPTDSTSNNLVEIEYDMAHPGSIHPDSLFWYAAAFKDKLQNILTFGHLGSAKLSLDCADKRLQMAAILFEKGKPEMGLLTLNKAEQYLLLAMEHAANMEEGAEKNEFIQKTSIASLKHREIIEENILNLAPEDIKPEIIKTADLTKVTFTKAHDTLHSLGMNPPKNPFNSN